MSVEARYPVTSVQRRGLELAQQFVVLNDGPVEHLLARTDLCAGPHRIGPTSATDGSADRNASRFESASKTATLAYRGSSTPIAGPLRSPSPHKGSLPSGVISTFAVAARKSPASTEAASTKFTVPISGTRRVEAILILDFEFMGRTSHSPIPPHCLRFWPLVNLVPPLNDLLAHCRSNSEDEERELRMTQILQRGNAEGV